MEGGSNVVSQKASAHQQTSVLSDSLPDTLSKDSYAGGVDRRPALPLPLTVDADVQRWIDYVQSLSERDLVTPTVSTASRLLWKKLVSALPSAHPPDASPTEDGTLLMSWIRAEHHLEIEVLPSGQYVWFYRNHELNQDDIGKGESSDDLVPDLLVRAQAVFA